jgi:circadian clock protein KaiB
MTSKPRRDAPPGLHRLPGKARKPRYLLRLYITGTTPQSLRALANIKRICEERLRGHYRLDVIDLYQQPQLAQSAQIVAAPTLIKQMPLPARRILGDMSKTERVLAGLGVLPTST